MSECGCIILFNRDTAARALSVGVRKIDLLKTSGDLIPVYPNADPHYTYDELKRWAYSLPTTPPNRR